MDLPAPGPDLPPLTLDAGLLPDWDGPPPLGLAAASRGPRAAVVVVTAEPVPEGVLAGATRRFADRLHAGSLDLVAASGRTLPEVLRDWLYQAGQGSGRGVRIRLEVEAGRLRLLLSSWDSSAREVVLRLASAQDPALAALAALLPYAGVDLIDEG